jgi:hypothetical protein
LPPSHVIETLKKGKSTSDAPELRADLAGLRFVRKHVPNSLPFVPPREAWLHRLASQAQAAAAHPFTTDIVQTRTSFRRTSIDMTYLAGAPGKVIDNPVELGDLVLSIERSSRAVLRRNNPPALRYLLFSRYGARRRRYDLRLLAKALQPVLKLDEISQGLQSDLLDLAVRYEEFDRSAATSDLVLSHLDPYDANFLRVGGRLHVIDWGEAYLGRVGFDAGSYLMRLLRIRREAQMLDQARIILGGYRNEDWLTPADIRSLPEAVNRIFVPRSLWYWLWPKTVERFRSEDRMPDLRERLAFLIECGRSPPWQAYL